MSDRFGAIAISDFTPHPLFRLGLAVVIAVFCLPTIAMPQPAASTQLPNANENGPEAATDQLPPPGHVTVDGNRVLTVYQPVAGYTPQERADKIADRIIAAAQDPNTFPDSVALEPRDAWTEITANGKLLMAVTNVDAKAAGKMRDQLATENAGKIRQCITTYRLDHSWHSITRDILYTIAATVLLLPLIWIVRRMRQWVRRRLENWVEDRTQREERKTAFQVSITYIVSLAMSIGAVVHWLLLLAVFEIYLSVVLSFFPQTRAISRAITQWILGALSAMGDSALAYIPNLFVIALVGVIAGQVFRLISMVCEEIGKGNLVLGGFYPEWAQPTAKLLRLLVLVLVIIIIFPYLPGSKSPAFQGISIFVGVLLSLGSSSAVANAIAGVILTYMRSFSVGDWVKIGDTLGKVVERNMLVTRILTPKQETITIPNSAVMSGSVMNYTREAINAGVIFHTTVTIGYDAPWRTVHQLLINAAYATEHVLHDPQPFVLQSGLNDFYVSYELNAYTDAPTEMLFIYSNLHQNIQDRFNEAGVEICSPHFSSLRDGNTIAIPEQNIPAGYTAPAFQIREAKKEMTGSADLRR